KLLDILKAALSLPFRKARLKAVLQQSSSAAHQARKMRGDVLGILVLLKYCSCSGVVNFEGDVRDFVVGKNKLFVLTGDSLHQMKHDLTEEEIRVDINNDTHRNQVNLLVPFDINGTLITCGSLSRGYCEVLDLKNISDRIYYESNLVIGQSEKEKLVAFIVGSGNNYYLLSGTLYLEDCNSELKFKIQLMNTRENIFSYIEQGSHPQFTIPTGDVERVDGFVRGSPPELYLFLNTKKEGFVYVLWMNSSRDKKSEMIKSLKAASVRCCSDKPRPVLVASAGFLLDTDVIWAGVFSARNQVDPENTAVALYNITPNPLPSDGKMHPLSVVFNYSSISSVAAERKGPWIVLFMGTSDGQLIKLVLDEKFTAGCPTVLYKSDDERAVLPKILLDPVDRKHVYIVLSKQLRRVPVARCGKCKTLEDCRAALDPLCGWCLNKQRCSTQDECLNTPWVSIPKASFQNELITFHMAKKSPSQITLHLALNLESSGSPGFSCAFFTSGNVKLCDSADLQEVFPNCSCTFSSQQLHSGGAFCASHPGVSGPLHPRVVIGGPALVYRDTHRKLVRNSATKCLFPVFDHSNETLRIHIPPSELKGRIIMCVVTPDNRCHGNSIITYSSQPRCSGVQPRNTWKRGGRKIEVQGANMEFVEMVKLHSFQTRVLEIQQVNFNSTGAQGIWFYSLPYDTSGKFSLVLNVGNSTIDCVEEFSYMPDPEFTVFTTLQVNNYLQVNIKKKEDELNLTESEVKVRGVMGEKEYECVLERIEFNAIICRIKEPRPIPALDSVIVMVGDNISETIKSQSAFQYSYLVLLVIIIVSAVVGVIFYKRNQKKMNKKMNKQLEMLESNIRRDIRQGFVDLQTEKSDLIDNAGAIPFLDYKHFALKIFFPEAGPLAAVMVRDFGQDTEQAAVDDKCQAFARLIRDKQFLSGFVQALEEQKNFNVKDRCTVASLLTLALHGDLLYLTEIMEDLLQSLMDQISNSNPKLLLRRTESIVEKLLTNWMSICLYGFLRQISKGPVDSVTEKALYTLSEDWLLGQVQDFEALRLKVVFAVGTGGEVSEPLEVTTLSCDTVHQVKEKILQTFQRKFGFPYTQQIREIEIECEREGKFLMLQEVDETSEIRGNVTLLNTLQHYQVGDGACIKVITTRAKPSLKTQSSVKDDENFSVKYFHLVDPDMDTELSKHPEKKAIKFKEIYLTKLLSTKVAIHSFVENLFRCIWGLPNDRAPLAVKYFFDFLDAQADRKKMSDPDVLHIWKTNSLPLRFWVNILKNPNFVFSDLEKTPHLDGCLSHSPTNKLLYAKDIPLYKQEVRSYYKLVKDQPPVSSQELKSFLKEESKKHENEFNESAALRELYKYMLQYFNEISRKLEQTGAPAGLREEMHRVKGLFDNQKRSGWS
ncbi:hypothetical protein DNTS_023867, partial [Danionella cerebrum]